jgi:hypothetical protein
MVSSEGQFRYQGTSEPRSIPPAFGQEKQKIFNAIKQCVTNIASASLARALLDIVCFIGQKAEEKQQDGAAFQGMSRAWTGRYLLTGSIEGVDSP